MSRTMDAAPGVQRIITAPRRRTLQRRSEGMLGIFAIPAVVWYAIFTIGPLVAVFYVSLLKWGDILAPARWAGISNYTFMFSDPVFWGACWTTALQILGVVPVLLVCAFMLGYYISLNPPGVRVLRPLLFIPGLMSLATQAVVFFSILSPNGLLNSVLSTLGLEKATSAWLADPSTALPSLIAVSLWGGIGYVAILFGSNLSGIDRSIYEAAEIDGASKWRTMWQIAFPMTIDYFGVIAMLQFLWNLFSSAALILLLTQGGPGTSTTTLSWMVYQKAFLQNNIGYSQAIGVFLFVIGLIGILVIRRVFRPRF